jgi:hypothetical protein
MSIKDLFKLEQKLILRNIRPKILLCSLFLMLKLLSSPNIERYPFVKLMLFIFSTGSFFTYSQFWFAWDSTYFSLLMTIPNSIKAYIQAKFWFNFIYIMVISLVLSFFFNQIQDFFPYLIASLLYNVGVNTNLMLYAASFNLTKMNIWKVQIVFEGSNSAQFISTSLFLGLPTLLYAIISFLFSHQMALLSIGLFGFIALLFYKSIIIYLVNNLIKRKKILLESYNSQ